jgi:hypothetical protein
MRQTVTKNYLVLINRFEVRDIPPGERNYQRDSSIQHHMARLGQRTHLRDSVSWGQGILETPDLNDSLSYQFW